MSSKVMVSACQLGKHYNIYDKPSHRLIESLPFQAKRGREFWALRNINFELKRGQTLGIVGRNGSGKSTLLQLLSGILTASEGRVETHGRVGALLELGSGFNPEFTGIENVFLNASVLGLTKQEVEENLQAILDFAGIGDFADQPVKTYSSGMSIRLAFAVQALLKPDVLIVDEALAVGDELFQKKCYAHLRTLKNNGTSILLVTHNCQQIVQHCDVAMLLHQGEQILWGSPKQITTAYQRLMSGHVGENWKTALDSIGGTPAQQRPTSAISYPEQGGRIKAIQILNAAQQEVTTLAPDEAFFIVFHYETDIAFTGLRFGCHIANNSGLRITGQGYPGEQQHGLTALAGSQFSIRFAFRPGLQPGVYFIGGGFWNEREPQNYVHRVLDHAVLRIESGTPLNSMGVCHLTASDPQLEWQLPVPAET